MTGSEDEYDLDDDDEDDDDIDDDDLENEDVIERERLVDKVIASNSTTHSGFRSSRTPDGYSSAQSGRPRDYASASEDPAARVISWERVTEMEAYVGISVSRATCRASASAEGFIEISIIAELTRRPEWPPAGGETYLKLTAVAEAADGEFLGCGMAKIRRWDAFPPLVIERLTIQSLRMPSRFRLYPEIS